jgi:hypothetical protein
VNQVLSPAAEIAPPSHSISGEARQISEALQQLAVNALAVCDGVACVITWRRASDEGSVQAPDQMIARAPLSCLLALVGRQNEHLPEGAIVRLEPGQLGMLANARLNIGGAIQGFARSSAEVSAIVLAPVGRRAAELEALAQLTYDRASGIIAMNELAASRSFWQKQASTSGEQAAAARSELVALTAERAALQGIITDCLKLPPPRRFAGLGARVARFGAFGAWLTAVFSEGELRVAAASSAMMRVAALGADSAAPRQQSPKIGFLPPSRPMSASRSPGARLL